MSHEALALSLRREPLCVTAALLWSSEKSILPKLFSFPWEIKPPLIRVPRQRSFVINLMANLIFTPIQFGMRTLPLATLDILIVWGTIIWMAAAISSHYRWVAVAQLPYLAWVSLATTLQLS